MQVECKVLDKAFYEEFPLPTYASTGAAALDLRACLPEDKVIEPNETLLIGTELCRYNPLYFPTFINTWKM